MDPLHLTDRLSSFELTGVSADYLVIGYSSELSCQQSSAQIRTVLQADGWVLFDDNGQSMLSFRRDNPDAFGTSALFVQCIPLGQGSSIVVQRW